MRVNVKAFAEADKIQTKASFEKMEFPKHGDYLYRLDVFQHKEDRKGLGLFVAEFTCVHVFDTVEGKPSHIVGERINKVTKQESDYYVKDIKSIIVAATGCEDSDIGQLEILEAFGCDENGEFLGERPMDGQYITLRVKTREYESKNKPGNTFPITNFLPAVAPEDLMTILAEDVQAKFYTDEAGNNVLEQMAAE